MKPFASRLNRLGYLAGSLPPALLALCVYFVLLISDPERLFQVWEIISFLLFWIWFVYVNASLSIRRLHDIGGSGWWYLMGWVPVIGTGLFLVLLFKQGAAGENQYGKPQTYGWRWFDLYMGRVDR